MMGKRKGPEKEPKNPQKGKGTSRISRACDRCQHRKLACDENELSCQQCLKANTWCTTTCNLSRTPIYRGQFAFLERTVENQQRENRHLLAWLRSLGHNVSAFEYQDSEAMRYEAWKHARSVDTNRPWDREDQQATLTIERVLRDKSTNPPPPNPDRSAVVDPSMESSTPFIPPPLMEFTLPPGYPPIIGISGPPYSTFEGFPPRDTFHQDYYENPLTNPLTNPLDLEDFNDMDRAQMRSQP